MSDYFVNKKNGKEDNWKREEMRRQTERDGKTYYAYLLDAYFWMPINMYMHHLKK